MPATRQPKWQFVDNLGDHSPLDYGGYFVFRDKTGVYAPEAELLLLDNEEDENSTYTIYRIILENLKLVDGYLVPAKYEPNWSHPLERYDEWFHEELSKVADFVSRTKEDMEAALTSSDPLMRADAWRNIYDYFGWENGDSDPLRGLTKSEVKKRYRGILDKYGRVKEKVEKHQWEVIVGNIGTVYSGTSEVTATKHFNEYSQQSRESYGRAAGETVTLMRDGEIYTENPGTLEG